MSSGAAVGDRAPTAAGVGVLASRRSARTAASTALPPISIENCSSSAIVVLLRTSTAIRQPRAGRAPQRERRAGSGAWQTPLPKAVRNAPTPRPVRSRSRHGGSSPPTSPPALLGDGRGQGARRRGLRLLQPAHRAGGALRPGGRRRRAAGDRRGDRARGRHREPRRQRALDVRRARRPPDGRRRGGAAVRAVRARRARRGDRSAVRRALPPRGGVEGARGRPGLRERPGGHRHRFRGHDRGAAARQSPAPPPPSTKINLDKGRVWLAKRQTVSLVKTGRPRCGGSRWASAGIPPSAAATSTSTRR